MTIGIEDCQLSFFLRRAVIEVRQTLCIEHKVFGYHR